MQLSSSMPVIDPAKTTGLTTIPFPVLPGSTSHPRVYHILPNSLPSIFRKTIQNGSDTFLYTMDNAREIETAEILFRLRESHPVRMILLSAYPRQALEHWLCEKNPQLTQRYTAVALESDDRIVLSTQRTWDTASLYREFMVKNCSMVIRP